MSAGRAADDTTRSGSPNNAKNSDKPFPVYIIRSRTIIGSIDEMTWQTKWNENDWRIYGAFTCLATANNIARAMVPTDDGTGEMLYEQPDTRNHIPGTPFSLSFRYQQYILYSLEVKAVLVDQTVTEEWIPSNSLFSDNDEEGDEEGGKKEDKDEDKNEDKDKDENADEEDDKNKAEEEAEK